MKYTIFNIGKFKVKTGKVRISDPCYNLSDNGIKVNGITVMDVKNGDWNANILYKNNIVTELVVVHSEFLNNSNDWVKCYNNDIGVDSGMVCIVDDAFFGKEELIDESLITKYIFNKNDNKWSAFCFAKTENMGGIIPYGCVSKTGYGDGVYSLYTKKINNEIVAIKVVFDKTI